MAPGGAGPGCGLDERRGIIRNGGEKERPWALGACNSLPVHQKSLARPSRPE